MGQVISDGRVLQDSQAQALIAAAAAAGAVISFNTRTGAITLSKADVTGTGLAAADVGALAAASNLSDLANAGTARTSLGLGTAATQASTAFDAAGAAATEQTRALAAEALLAPLASPALTGTATAAALTASGQVQGQSLRASGNTGAAQATRLVGGNATGAPASGTWAVGDLAVDQTGTVYQCVTAGTPGTWVTLQPTADMFPGDMGVKGWSVDPATTSGSMTMVAQTIYFTRVRVPKKSTIAGLGWAQTTNGATITAGTAGIALYSADGTTKLAGVAANPAGFTAGVGYQTSNFDASYAADPGYYLAAMWVGTAGTMPIIARGTGTATANIGVAATLTALRFGTAQTNQNASAGPASLSGAAANPAAVFVALI